MIRDERPRAATGVAVSLEDGREAADEVGRVDIVFLKMTPRPIPLQITWWREPAVSIPDLRSIRLH